MSQIRYDRAPIKIRRDEDGFLYSDSTVARTGILMYRNADGTPRRELRLPEDAGSPVTLQSMVGKPVIMTHDGGFVTADNARTRIVGTMLNARQDGPLTNSEIVIHDGEAIRAAESGELAELSLGYRLTMDEKSGYYNADTNELRADAADGFEPFDAIQRNIVVNHVALVKRARAGSVARLNFDGDEIIDNGDPLMKIQLGNGVEVEVTDEVAQHINTLKTRLDGVSAELSTTKGTLTAVQGEVAALKTEVGTFPAKLEQARADAAEELKTSELLKSSVAHKITDVADKTDIEIKKMFIAAVMPTVNMDGKDDLEINGAFDYALAANPATETNGAVDKSKHIGGDRNDSAANSNGSAASAYEKMLTKLGIK